MAKKPKDFPNFRDKKADPIGQAMEEHITNENVKSIPGYGAVIGWLEKERPVGLLEYLFRKGVISTWPPGVKDQYALIVIHKLWCKPEFLRMQLTRFNRAYREKIVKRPEFGRVENWVYTHLDSSKRRYVTAEHLMRAVKDIFTRYQLLPPPAELAALPPAEREKLIKEQQRSDVRLSRLIERVRRKWYSDRKSQRRNSPGLRHGERAKQ